MADVTYYYGWGPHDVDSLTWSVLCWWQQQALRINRVRAANNG